MSVSSPRSERTRREPFCGVPVSVTRTRVSVVTSPSAAESERKGQLFSMVKEKLPEPRLKISSHLV